jgi:hypothetical protein
MKDYLLRLVELAGAGFMAGAGEYVLANGFELSKAGLQGLAVAGGMAAYGLVVKRLGDKARPTVK